jgi:hypothetical protein
VQRQLIIALALLISAPSIAAALSGALTIDALCLRLAVAVVFSYAGVRLVTRLIIGYASGSQRWTAPPPDDRDDARAE